MTIADRYRAAQEEFQRRLDDYERAAQENSNDVTGAFERAAEAWWQLRAAAPTGSPEAGADEDMHIVLAFSHAVAAGHAAEAKRLFQLMSVRRRAAVDASHQGVVKIWTQGD